MSSSIETSTTKTVLEIMISCDRALQVTLSKSYQMESYVAETRRDDAWALLGGGSAERQARALRSVAATWVAVAITRCFPTI
jgi:hypothetical protein